MQENQKKGNTFTWIQLPTVSKDIASRLLHLGLSWLPERVNGPIGVELGQSGWWSGPQRRHGKT